MPEKNEQFNRFINRTLAEAAGEPAQQEQPRATTINMLVGSVAGNVIFMGDVSPANLEKVLRNRMTGKAGATK